KYVRFVGAVTLEKVADYMNAADIFVLVNDFSNVSNGLYEAMVCGKCIVTLDNGDTRELIEDGKTGRLIRAGNEDEIVNELSKAILDVLEDDELRARLGENARIYAQEHFQTWEERMAMEARLIKELVGKGGVK
ncbi:MAG: glycosyltransferase family 4 protein, partial [Candidatus Omnitrophica bacterium]|nr:glycosyltransferase family 4 protein [Candidatus Omnitrophota bacterium]